MYTLHELFRPVVEKYNEFLNGSYLSGLLQFKGQDQVGGDYVSKVFRSQAYQYRSKYEYALQSVQNPTYLGFLKDNACRLLLLNGVERLVAAYQAAPSINRVGRPSSLSFLFTQIMNDGAFRGTLRGLSMNFLQASLVLWPAALITNRGNNGFFEFMATFSILDALLHPLDTIKNRMYGNTIVPVKLREVFGNIGLLGAYRGLFPKLLFNIPYGAALYTTASGNDLSWAFWLATLAAYPLNTAKVVSQVSGGSAFIGNGYRGAIPFILVNYLCAWQLTSLFSKQKLANLQATVKKQSLENLGFY